MFRILLLALCAMAPAIAADKYFVYETEHFELLTDGSRGRAQEILAQFERVRAFFHKMLAGRQPVLKPRIVVFKKESDYRDYSPNQVSAGHFVPILHRDLIAIGPTNGDRDMRLVVHEYLHLLVRYSDNPMPVWMNEGIAELYSNIQQVGKVIRVGTPIPEHIFQVRNDWIPLQEVVGADHESKYYNRRAHAGSFYGISWALVHMLTLDERYKGKFGGLARALSSGVPAEEAFRTSTGKSIAEVEKDLQGYIRGSSVNVVNFETQFEKVDQKVPPREATDYEWGVATADLLTGSRRFDNAEARLEALTNMEPTKPQAWESLAVARLLHKADGVEAAFLKAREAGSVNPHLAYFGTAMTKDRKAAREFLQAAVEKYPDYVESKILLAEMELYSREFQASFDRLRTIRKISPSMTGRYFPVYIQATWYLNDMEKARGAASQFVRVAASPADKENAKRWFAFAMKDHPPKRAVASTASAATAGSIDAGQQEPATVAMRRPEETVLQEVNEQLGEPGFDEDPTIFRSRRTPLTFLEGVLIRLECKQPGVLHLKTETGVLKMLIDSPGALQMVGAEDGKGELTCDEQARPVKLGYYPKEGLAESASGLARSIEFLKKQ